MLGYDPLANCDAICYDEPEDDHDSMYEDDEDIEEREREEDPLYQTGEEILNELWADYYSTRGV